MHTSLKLRVRKRSGTKPDRLLTVRPGRHGQREQVVARQQGEALLVVRVSGVIVHVHCKARGCGNEWATEDGVPLARRFKVEGVSGPVDVTCLRCKRQYLAV